MKSVMEHEIGKQTSGSDGEYWLETQVIPFRVIPKSGPGKWKLILDLSSPQGGSVNDGIDKDLYSLTYLFIDQMAARIMEMEKGTLMAMFDLKVAYHNVPVHPNDW